MKFNKLKLLPINLKLDSAQIDQDLGFHIDEIEACLLKRAQMTSSSKDVYSLGKSLHQGHQTWVGLDPQVLQTPYKELFEICQHLELSSEAAHVIDLGAGYGRLGIVLQSVSPKTKFTGYEYVKERVDEGNRVLQFHQCHNACLIEQDLLHEKFTLPKTNYYFLYDYGFPHQIRQTLNQLEVIGREVDLKIVARGKGVLSQIHQEHPWLFRAFTPYHSETFSIYSNYCDIG